MSEKNDLLPLVVSGILGLVFPGIEEAFPGINFSREASLHEMQCVKNNESNFVMNNNMCPGI